MAFWSRPKKPPDNPPEFSPEDQAIVDSFVQVYPSTTIGYTDEQIQLQSLLESGLVRTDDAEFVRSIAFAVSPSFKQDIWIKTTLNQILNNSVKYHFENIFKILDFAPKKFYYRFRGYQLKLSVATDSSKYPGAISITSTEPQGPGYLGRIDKDQSVYIVRDAATLQEEIIKVIVDLNDDTLNKITQLARAEGECCFCQKPLAVGTDDTKRGYDSICARAYELPHADLIIPDPKVTVQQLLNIAATALPDESLAQKMARGPFDPAVMNAILGENPGKRW